MYLSHIDTRSRQTRMTHWPIRTLRTASLASTTQSRRSWCGAMTACRSWTFPRTSWWRHCTSATWQTGSRRKTSSMLDVVKCLLSAGNENVPEIIINDSVNFFLKLQSAFWWFQTITVSECCLIKLLPYILVEKYINFFALEVASPGNQHCVRCIGTLSFPIQVKLFVT